MIVAEAQCCRHILSKEKKKTQTNLLFHFLTGFALTLNLLHSKLSITVVVPHFQFIFQCFEKHYYFSNMAILSISLAALS